MTVPVELSYSKFHRERSKLEKHRKPCDYPDCPLKEAENDIAGKMFVNSLEERLVKLEITHATDVSAVYKKVDSVDDKFDRKFNAIIILGITQLALFVGSVIINHLNNAK